MPKVPKGSMVAPVLHVDGVAVEAAPVLEVRFPAHACRSLLLASNDPVQFAIRRDCIHIVPPS